MKTSGILGVFPQPVDGNSSVSGMSQTISGAHVSAGTMGRHCLQGVLTVKEKDFPTLPLGPL